MLLIYFVYSGAKHEYMPEVVLEMHVFNDSLTRKWYRKDIPLVPSKVCDKFGYCTNLNIRNTTALVMSGSSVFG
jgi:hypothetical protein